MSSATIRGAQLAYDVAGSGPGPDVVLIHFNAHLARFLDRLINTAG